MSDDDRPDDHSPGDDRPVEVQLAAANAEIARLRRLVGPSEASYLDLHQDLLAARDVARGAQARAGTLEGQLHELHVALERARQDQDQFQRLVLDRARNVAQRVRRRTSRQR